MRCVRYNFLALSVALCTSQKELWTLIAENSQVLGWFTVVMLCSVVSASVFPLFHRLRDLPLVFLGWSVTFLSAFSSVDLLLNCAGLATLCVMRVWLGFFFLYGVFQLVVLRRLFSWLLCLTYVHKADRPQLKPSSLISRASSLAD